MLAWTFLMPGRPTGKVAQVMSYAYAPGVCFLRREERC